MTKQRLISLILISALAIIAVCLVGGCPALESYDAKLGGSTPPLKAGQTALIGLHVTNSSDSPVVLKSATAASHSGAELINAYADEQMMIGFGFGPNDYANGLPLLTNYRLQPGETINVLLEFQAPMITGEYAIRDIRLHYGQHGLPRTLKFNKFEIFTIIVE